MKTEVTDELIQSLLNLSRLLIQFSKTNRTNYLDPQRTLESDTDHTVMLAVIACAVAASYEPRLDIGKVAQYAIVHDLVEVYAGDVDTINFHKIDQKKKNAQETKALARIKQEFGTTLPWIHETIEAYQILDDPESRFIKSLDKAMPPLTHLHSENHKVNEAFDNPEELESSVSARHDFMKSSYGYDQELALKLRSVIYDKAVDAKYRYHGIKRKKK